MHSTFIVIIIFRAFFVYQNSENIRRQLTRYELTFVADVKEEISANRRPKFWTNTFILTLVIPTRAKRPRKSSRENAELPWVRYRPLSFLIRIRWTFVTYNIWHHPMAFNFYSNFNKFLSLFFKEDITALSKIF